MWNLRRKKNSDTSAVLQPSENELWLMNGEFRDWSVDSAKESYYGICACSSDSIRPPEESLHQHQFYQFVYDLTQEILQHTPSVVFVTDTSRSDNWKGQTDHFKQLALSYGGVFTEEHSSLNRSYAYAFSKMPIAFLEEVYWWMADHSYNEDFDVQYSLLEKAPPSGSTISDIKTQTVLNVLIDEIHPVLILQRAPSYSLARITDALLSVCNRNGWTLLMK